DRYSSLLPSLLSPLSPLLSSSCDAACSMCCCSFKCPGLASASFFNSPLLTPSLLCSPSTLISIVLLSSLPSGPLVLSIGSAHLCRSLGTLMPLNALARAEYHDTPAVSSARCLSCCSYSVLEFALCPVLS